MGLLVTEKRPISQRHERAICYALLQIRTSLLAPFVKDVLLYGSCARKEQRWKSDVDLCMILNVSVEKLKDYKKALHMLKGQISEEHANSAEVDLKILIGDDWEKDNTLFYRNLRKDGISIWQ